MSFPVGEIGIVITIAKLLYKLQQDYASAPDEATNLSNELEHLQHCIAPLQKSPPQSAIDRKRLETVLKPVLNLLEQINEVCDRYSDLKSGRRIWDRATFPKTKVHALQKQIHSQFTGLTVFNMGLQNKTLAKISDILEEIGGVLSQRFANNENGWELVVAELERRGLRLSKEAAATCKEPIKQHLEALSEVEQAESQLMVYENTTIGPDDAVDEDIAVGPPTPAHLSSLVCPGAAALQSGKQDVIKQSKNHLLQHFGASKYEIICRHCSFHGFQDEPLKSKDKPYNTPLFFAPRQEALKPSSVEYYFEVHRRNRSEHDGIWYHTIFFWKCHIKAREPLLHISARYQCVFCPLANAYSNTYSRDSLLEHIRKHHVQTPPPRELREKFNVWIDDKNALFLKDEGRMQEQPFDIMIPKAYGRTDYLKAERAKHQADIVEAANAQSRARTKQTSDANIREQVKELHWVAVRK
ncbi:uncharacterized protein LY89DRAFT_736065 [Mollisia scopiformis]|uniref:Uncharacterized protein n=1 Tax=Mollisia scopiformis TaxID=149040 RepID=A0A194X4A2_MOLSC|nr:uncharacterized protein LY89DRAFT_736065 [Mollisia scopiformis]KUJ15005.1 hypothetical protein LY89DRAFT_736065 [Mollisia scopiformis]